MIYFKLFANCIISKGKTNAIISDLQYSRFKIIPLLLANILKDNQKSINQIYTEYSHEKEGLKLYIDLLLNDGWGFYTQKPLLFPKLNLDWDFPYRITNSVIVYKNLNSLQRNICELDKLGCFAVQLRLQKKIEINVLLSLLNSFNNSGINSLGILMPYKKLEHQDYIKLKSTQRRLHSLIMYSAPYSKQEKIFSNSLNIKISPRGLNDLQADKNLNSFTTNIPFFTEAQKHHTYFNRKISIDAEGNIKNCLSL